MSGKVARSRTNTNAGEISLATCQTNAPCVLKASLQTESANADRHGNINHLRWRKLRTDTSAHTPAHARTHAHTHERRHARSHACTYTMRRKDKLKRCKACKAKVLAHRKWRTQHDDPGRPTDRPTDQALRQAQGLRDGDTKTKPVDPCTCFRPSRMCLVCFQLFHSFPSLSHLFTRSVCPRHA